MKLADFEREPCQCERCVLAGVSDRPQRRDPRSGAWLHGDPLRRWYLAKEAFVALKQRITQSGDE